MYWSHMLILSVCGKAFINKILILNFMLIVSNILAKYSSKIDVCLWLHGKMHFLFLVKIL